MDVDRERLRGWGEQLGLARTVRILETFGRAMREMKSAPEKIVVLEVALVRLVRADLDSSLEALAERVTKLERMPSRASLSETPPPPAPTLRPIGATAHEVKSEPVAPPSPEPSPVATGVESAVAALDFAEVSERFSQRVVARTSRAAQLILKSAQVQSLDGLVLTIAVPSDEMRQNTEMITQGLRGALEHEFKMPLNVRWVVDSSLVVATPSAPSAPRTPRIDPPDSHDESYSPDESAVVVTSAADHLITEMFPGSEEIT